MPIAKGGLSHMGISSVFLLIFKFFGNATLVAALFRFAGSVFKTYT
ncbi:MAG: hypothetical protein KJS70_06225 [Actinomycetales bacterium]|nr:hypothetical protein [Actinomycetales bacterium]